MNEKEKIDYSNQENWCKCEFDGDKNVDTIYIYPTICLTCDFETTIEENKKFAEINKIYEAQASVYSYSTNIFMPYYRSIGGKGLFSDKVKGRDFLDIIKEEQGYKDVTNALDYYFENYNNGKPFILASHSQGTTILIHVLTDYMQIHPEYLSRMIACYGIGYAFSKNLINKFTNLKFAQGETDTNCIISYNTYGPEFNKQSMLLREDGYCINPLNWKTDDTYAPVEMNKGSYSNFEHTKGLSDAQINLEKGFLISNADKKYEAMDTLIPLFGTHSFHMNDYGFFYENIKENVAKRIESYLNK